jgi:hypothetical protein
MKSIFYIILIIVPFKSIGQLSSNYRDCLIQFYELLHQEKITIDDARRVMQLSDNTDSLFLLEKQSNIRGNQSLQIEGNFNMVRQNNSESYIMRDIKTYLSELTQDLPLEELLDVINDAKSHQEDDEFSEYVVLTFPNKRKVFFALSIEDPSEIIFIWLNNCDYLYDLISRSATVRKMTWIGTLKSNLKNDSIHESPTRQSSVNYILKKNEIFYYSPIGGSNWYQVYIELPGGILGYIHKNHILMYPDFSDKLKSKIINK